MLKVDHLKAGYHGLDVVQNISLNVKKGEIVALLGSNGSGKTTALRAITGIIKPTTGKIEYEGKSIAGIVPHELVSRGIAMVPEGRRLFPKMTILENLQMGAYAVKDKGQKADSLTQIYAIFPRLEERKNQLAGTLSGGEQQMVAIGRALMSNPQLLILDEPSLGIMPKLVDEIFEFIIKINQEGMSILIVEQNAEKTLEFADYAYVIANGETIIEGTGSQLLENDQVQKVYLGIT